MNQGSSIVELDPANASAFMSQSQHQQNIDALNQSQDNSYIDVPSTPAVPYTITQRKAAAASLFEYDADAPDITLPASVPPGEMVELVKKQNRENRKRLKKVRGCLFFSAAFIVLYFLTRSSAPRPPLEP